MFKTNIKTSKTISLIICASIISTIITLASQKQNRQIFKNAMIDLCSKIKNIFKNEE